MKKRCPFCESDYWVKTVKVELVDDWDIFASWDYQVRCAGCNARGPQDASKKVSESLFYGMRWSKD